jgi:hypothetical protein
MSTTLNRTLASTVLVRGGAAAIIMLLAACSGETVVGRKIEFGQGGGSEPYRTSGWSHTEQKFTWTEGNSAKLSLPIGKESGALILNVAMAAFVHPPELPKQPVEVIVNGQKLAEWQVTNDLAAYNVTIPADTVKAGGKLEIEFRTPKAISPKSVGGSEDFRVLGACVMSLEVAKPT